MPERDHLLPNESILTTEQSGAEPCVSKLHDAAYTRFDSRQSQPAHSGPDRAIATLGPAAGVVLSFEMAAALRASSNTLNFPERGRSNYLDTRSEEPRTVAAQNARFGGYQRTTEMIPQLKPDALRSRTQAEFVSIGIEPRPREMRTYTSDNHVSIMVPEDYAQQLDQVRELRIKAEGNDAQAEAAQRQLAEHPFGDRMLPEDVLSSLDSLPDLRQLSNARRFMLLNENNPRDRFYRQNGRPYLSSDAFASSDGTITFYRGRIDGLTTDSFVREAAALLRNQRQDDAAMFDIAAMVESDGFFARHHATVSNVDNWAVHFGEYVLHPSAGSSGRLEAIAQRAPVRAAVFAKALEKMLASVPDSPQKESLMNRVAYLNETAKPQAVQELTRQINQSANTGTARLMTRLLADIRA